MIWQLEAAGLDLLSPYAGWVGGVGGGQGCKSLAFLHNKRSILVKLVINGEYREVSAATVFDLLAELGLHPKGTVVERNRQIVDREAYRETNLSEGDVLELVRLVGGG